jgi:hypothetical protein
MGSMANFQLDFLSNALNGFRSGSWGQQNNGILGIHGPWGPWGPWGSWGPWGPGPWGPRPGPGPFAVGGRSQQKHVLEKSGVSPAEKGRLISLVWE